MGRLLSAEMPVLIVDFSGRNPQTVTPLVALAESLGLPVIDRGNRFNFPNTHQLNLSGAHAELLKDTDLVIALEVQDLRSALGSFLELTDEGMPANGAYVVTIGSNDLLTSKWAADYQQFVPVNRSITADSLKTLTVLRTVVEDKDGAFSTSEFTQKRDARIKLIAASHTRARGIWSQQAQEAKSNEVINVATAVGEIHEAVRGEPWILTNTGSITVDGWVKKLWSMERPQSYLGLNGGGGLGYGLGASVGAALAHKGDGQICINLQTDGDFLYTPSALWSLSAYDIPLLVIVMNNRLYLNSRQHAAHIAGNRGRDIDRAHIATSFCGNPVDFVSLAQSFNIYALPCVEALKDVAPAVKSAIAFIKAHGKPALIEILME